MLKGWSGDLYHVNQTPDAQPLKILKPLKIHKHLQDLRLMDMILSHAAQLQAKRLAKLLRGGPSNTNIAVDPCQSHDTVRAMIAGRRAPRKKETTKTNKSPCVPCCQ